MKNSPYLLNLFLVQVCRHRCCVLFRLSGESTRCDDVVAPAISRTIAILTPVVVGEAQNVSLQEPG